MRLFSWRWHPPAVDTARSYDDEPTTLVTFEFRDVPEGTLLTIVVSTSFHCRAVPRRIERTREPGRSRRNRSKRTSPTS